MLTIPVYNKEGEKIEEMEISEVVFGAESNDALAHQVYTILSGNLRETIAHTKDRAERAGSGRKPWKQKGTGRARSGSVRSPLWKKGGVVFGPNKEQNFHRSVNVRMRRKAVSVVLSEKVRVGDLIVVDSFDFTDKKTKIFSGLLEKLKIQTSVLIGLEQAEKDVKRMCRNIKKLSVDLASDIDVKQLLDHKKIVVSKEGIHAFEQRLVA